MANNEVMLIVDDSKLARMMIKGIVSETSPEISFLEAANGEEALQCSEGKQITHMTIDYNMPGMNGLELAEKLIKSCPTAQVSLITANIQETIKDRADKLGISFIAKPINGEKISHFLKAG